MSISNLRVFARNLVYLGQDLKNAFWPGQLVDALREADFAREALVDFEAEHDGLDGGELPDFPGHFPDPLASCVASATEAPSSVDASVRSAGEAPPPDASPAEHSNARPAPAGAVPTPKRLADHLFNALHDNGFDYMDTAEVLLSDFKIYTR